MDSLTNKNEDMKLPKHLVGDEVVQCPLTSSPAIRSVVKLIYCKGCNFFIKYVEGTQDGRSYIECSYPRRVEVIDVCGEKKNG